MSIKVPVINHLQQNISPLGPLKSGIPAAVLMPAPV